MLKFGASCRRRHSFNMVKDKSPKKSTLEKIAAIVGNTVEEVYGVTGLSSYRTILDEIQTLLKKENFRDGVKVIKVSDTNYEVTVFCLLAFGVKVNEVIAELQEQIKYAIEKKLKISVTKINVFVRGIK